LPKASGLLYVPVSGLHGNRETLEQTESNIRETYGFEARSAF